MNWSNFGTKRVTASRLPLGRIRFCGRVPGFTGDPALAQNHKQRGRNVVDERTTSTLQNPFQIYDRLNDFFRLKDG